MVEKNAQTTNMLKAIRNERPDWIPARVGIMPATWKKYRAELEAIVREHPTLFPCFTGKGDYDFIAQLSYRLGTYVDHWGCVWENVEEGLEGIVVGHPLSDWKNLATFKPPTVPTDESFWAEYKTRFEHQKEQGSLARGGMEHGYMYMRLFYLRGFENLMIDIALKDPRLDKLIDMVLQYNLGMVQKQMELGAEIMGFGDDLGTQKSLPISPEDWRHYLKPCYDAIYGTCKKAGALVYVHTDGHILPIIDDLVECGVDVLNPQIRANGLENLVKGCKGKVCVDLDLDRQLFPFATPEQVRDHIKEAIDAFSPNDGGLMLYAECEPDIPLENIEALCEGLELYALGMK